MEGKVKLWNRAKGCGFLTPDDGSPDVFVHCTDLASGRHDLREGESVFFLITTGFGGPRAFRVRPIDNDPYDTAA